MLQQFDVAGGSGSYRLHFQVVAGNGGDSSDVRLARVEDELRKVFRFTGYSLKGEGYVTASQGAFDLTITVPDSEEPRGKYFGVNGVIRDQYLDLTITGPSTLQTQLGFRPGQTLILGSIPTPGETVFIVVNVADAQSA